MLCFSLNCFASDLTRELAYADIMQAKYPYELVWLKAGEVKFAALFKQSDRQAIKGAAIVMHDMGEYPDQEVITAQLRKELPEHSWSTLAIQMPLRESGAPVTDYFSLFPEAQMRIQAGINYLTQNNITNIVLVGYGLGGVMALNAQSEKNFDVKAIAVVSLPVINTDNKQAQTLELIKKITNPLLDIYAALDLDEVKATARDRRVAAKENENYRQMEIEAEDHTFLHQNGLVTKRVYGWLNRMMQ